MNSEFTADELQTLAVAMPESVMKHENGSIVPLVSKSEAKHLLHLYGAHYGLEPKETREETDDASLVARYPSMYRKK